LAEPMLWSIFYFRQSIFGNFRRFSPIFGKKIGGTNVVIYFLFSPIYFRQFSAIFANFRPKNWRNQCCDLFLFHELVEVYVKTLIHAKTIF
jgi:hypothetical protein